MQSCIPSNLLCGFGRAALDCVIVASVKSDLHLACIGQWKFRHVNAKAYGVSAF
jgi:hypothetical protein